MKTCKLYLHNNQGVCEVGKKKVRIAYSVTGFFHWHNHSGRTMALGSTQPLTEMSTRSVSWGLKVAGA